MEELYPGKGTGDGFHVAGSAVAYRSSSPTLLLGGNGSLVAGIRSFGRENLFVHQDGSNPNPAFDFRPLTGAFLYNTIEFDPSFDFSIFSQRIGDITYVSGAPARDFGGEVRQGIVTLHASGHWDREGLTLRISGELGDKSAFLGKAVAPEFRHATYQVHLKFPWLALRFIFYNEKGFIIENYQKHGTKDG